MSSCNDIMVMSLHPPRRYLSLCHIKTLKMSEDVLYVCHSPDGRLLAVALLDTTVKVFFVDTLKVAIVSLIGLSEMSILSSSSCLCMATNCLSSPWTYPQ